MQVIIYQGRVKDSELDIRIIDREHHTSKSSDPCRVRRIKERVRTFISLPLNINRQQTKQRKKQQITLFHFNNILGVNEYFWIIF